MPRSSTALRTRTTALLAALTAAALSPATRAQSTEILAIIGDAAPDANGSFLGLGSPALNDAGQAAFFGSFTGTAGGSSDDTGLFRSDGTSGALTQLAREGQAAPDNNGSLSSYSAPALNDAGQAAFFGILTGTAGGSSDDLGIFRSDGSSGGLTQLAREGQAAPDNNGSFSGFGNPALNDAGQAAFVSTLTGTAGGSSDNGGIFRSDGSSGGLTQLAREGQAAPDNNGSFSGFNSSVALNDAGQAAFTGFLTGTAGGGSDNSGLFRGDGTSGGLTQLAREGQAAPDNNGSFSSFGNPALNDAGQAAFVSTLTGTAGGSSDDFGIFRSDGSSGGLTQLAREGQAAPDNNGSFSGFGNPALNDAGQAAFVSTLTGTAGGTSDDFGIFRSDGSSGGLTQLAREGQAAPDNNGSFLSFNTPALNDAGQAVFRGRLTGTAGGSSDDRGLYFYDDLLGLIQIAREGDPFLGSTLTNLSFIPGSTLQDEGSGLNELGQVAYSFSLADGRQGIALYTIPEPASLALLALGAAALTRRQRRDTKPDDA